MHAWQNMGQDICPSLDQVVARLPKNVYRKSPGPRRIGEVIRMSQAELRYIRITRITSPLEAQPRD